MSGFDANPGYSAASPGRICGTAIAEISLFRVPHLRVRVFVEYRTYADVTDSRARTIVRTGRRARPGSGQGAGRRRRHQGVARRSRAADDSDPAAHLLDRQGRTDRSRLVEIRPPSITGQAGAVGGE